jgi:hypothetical protein
MALQTEVVQPFICLEALHCRTVGIMTVRASHLFFPDGMMGRILDLGLDVRVTHIATFRFWFGQEPFATWEMDLVAVNAAYIVEVVLTAGPVEPCMAVQTDSRLLCWCELITTENIVTIL